MTAHDQALARLRKAFPGWECEVLIGDYAGTRFCRATFNDYSCWDGPVCATEELAVTALIEHRNALLRPHMERAFQHGFEAGTERDVVHVAKEVDRLLAEGE